MSIEAPRDPKLIIDDLGFRAAWLEKTVQMNITKLEELAACWHTAPELRKAAQDLADDTRKSLTELQVSAVERLLVQNRVSAEIVQFSKPAPQKAPEAVST